MRVANTRWTREDIGRIAVMRESGLTWHQIGLVMGVSANAAQWAWRYFWAQALRRYERALEL